MTDLVVIVPSRGRPQAAAELADTFDNVGATARLVFAVDEDDPTGPGYLAALDEYAATTVHYGPAPSTMVKALNLVAGQYANEAFAIGFMGDDHRPRTRCFDQLYVDELRALGTGIVYGNDMLQGENIPTQVAMTSDIVRALGFMAPPSLVHLAVDNWWKDLGVGAECLSYLPGVVVEHMHPIAGKADWDAGHIRVNAQSMYERDLTEYARLQRAELPAAIEKVRALR